MMNMVQVTAENDDQENVLLRFYYAQSGICYVQNGFLLRNLNSIRVQVYTYRIEKRFIKKKKIMFLLYLERVLRCSEHVLLRDLNPIRVQLYTYRFENMVQGVAKKMIFIFSKNIALPRHLPSQTYERFCNRFYDEMRQFIPRLIKTAQNGLESVLRVDVTKRQNSKQCSVYLINPVQ